MSSLSLIERRRLEVLFQMDSGYVLDFSNSTFFDFFLDNAEIDIHSASYRGGGTSKANKIREFWRIESDALVGKIIEALIERRENIALYPADRELVDQCKRIAVRLLTAGPDLGILKETAIVFDAKYLAEQIRRIERSVDSDAALAIGTAKELVETCCKTILAERSVVVDGQPNISLLTRSVFRGLKLIPEGIPENAKGSGTIKVLLSNLAAITKCLAELRGLYGTGHGKEGRSKGLSARHARLAVGSAATLASFLFETHKEIT